MHFLFPEVMALRESPPAAAVSGRVLIHRPGPGRKPLNRRQASARAGSQASAALIFPYMTMRHFRIFLRFLKNRRRF